MNRNSGLDWTRLCVGWLLFVVLTGYQLAADMFGLPGASSSARSAVPTWLLPAEVIVAVAWTALLLALLPRHLPRRFRTPWTRSRRQ